MSTQLDNLHYARLVARNNGKRFKVGHNTDVEVGPNLSDPAIVYYHGNAVGRIEFWEVAVSDCGWSNSPTTRHRINSILRDNGIPFYVAQRDWVDTLYQIVDGEHVKVRDFDGYAQFKMNAGLWELED